MSRPWRIAVERHLMTADSPSVLTTAMLQVLATTAHTAPPSPAAFARWVAEMAEAGKLRAVIKGVYLNVLGHRNISPAAAAHWIRSRSVVSLSWVLEQAFITNNFGDTITCVIPTERTWPTPNTGDRRTAAGTFRFFAMPVHLVDAGELEDRQDLRFDYPRTTPEKAFLDWLFLGASHRSRLTRPPHDLDFDALDGERLQRLAQAMRLEALLNTWVEHDRRVQADEDVRENSATRMRF